MGLDILTKSEVVRRFQISRVTLDKWIRDGKISATQGKKIGSGKSAKYEWTIDEAEAVRVLTPRKGVSTDVQEPVKQDDTEVQLLRAEIDGLKALPAEKDKRILDAQTRADEWKSETEKARNHIKQLEYMGN